MLLDGGDANYGIKCVYKEPSKAELDQGRTGAAIFMSVWWCPDGRRLTLDIASCIIARRHPLAKSSEFGGLITQDSYTSFYARARVVNCNIVSSLTHVSEGMASGDKEPRPWGWIRPDGASVQFLRHLRTFCGHLHYFIAPVLLCHFHRPNTALAPSSPVWRETKFFF